MQFDAEHGAARIASVVCGIVLLAAFGPACGDEEQQRGDLEGEVHEAEPDAGPLGGVDVVLYESETGEEQARTSTEEDGSFAFSEVVVGQYQLRLEAPGLEPGYELQDDDLVVVDQGTNRRELTVDFQREFDLMVDGGVVEFLYDRPDESMSFRMSECEPGPDGQWEPIHPTPSPDSRVQEVNYDPEDECFRIEEVAIDVETGLLDLDIEDVLFPKIEFYAETEENGAMSVEAIEVEAEWLLDEVSGVVDFTEGTMELEVQARILVGGTAYVQAVPFDFGQRSDDLDCQFCRAWGGDVLDPTVDDNDEQIGEYRHESLQFSLTTGTTGPFEVSGQQYAAEDRRFVTVNNELIAGRLSEGPHGSGDPGGSSCGEFDLAVTGSDFAAEFNEAVGLPADPGSVFARFEFRLR